MRRFLGALVAIALFGGIAFFLLTWPRGLPARELAVMEDGDPVAGETWFWAGGCGSCHAAERAKGDDKLQLGGGLVLATDFGDFVAPNISMHPTDGIGSWSGADFANALMRGVSPEGAHYYPAFPYASYTRMEIADVADLWAFWQTLPEVAGRAPPSSLRFPYSIRRGIGLWKLAFLREDPIIAVPEDDAAALRGRYLVEAAGHCGECHTSRGIGGEMRPSRWLAGAPNPDGEGRIPNITPGEGGIGSWSAGDIAFYLESGFTPDFDSVGGSMVSVQDNMTRLSPEDRSAIADYLAVVPPLATQR